MINFDLRSDEYRFRDRDMGDAIEVSVSYSKGGINYFTGRTERRGVYVSVRPLSIEDGFIGYTAFSGYKMFIRELGRFSAKQVREVAEQLDEHAPEIAAAFRISSAEAMQVLQAALNAELATA